MQVAQEASAYAMLYHDTIRTAHRLKASDIHVKPTVRGFEIAFRVLSRLTPPWKAFEAFHLQPFVNEIKQQARMPLGISGEPLDGRISYPTLSLELRVNMTPTHFGEKIVIRLLDQSRSFSMSDLKIHDRAKSDLKDALNAKNGVILISGPTGSGKTTTLYTAVSSLDRSKLNVMTIEDPVEYTIPGITQIGVTRKLSFEKALRAILRQDPDVILVGEIRDKETADLCFKAASTGHLVLSTIHANGAVEVVQRLRGLGVEKYLLESCLRLSAAQRIVRQLCPQCAREAESKAIPEREERSKPGHFRIVGPGCKACNDAGYSGLLPILEYMGTSEIRTYADSGFSGPVSPRVSLKEAFFAHARSGLVDVRGVHEIE